MKGTPDVPLAVAALLTTGEGGAATTSESACVPVPAELAALSVTLNVPPNVGVPEMTPVVELRLWPAGKPAAPKLVGELVAVIV